jgi:hypothetical protein
VKPIDVLRYGAMAASGLVGLARQVVAAARGKPVPLEPVHGQSHTAEVRRQADQARADRQAREPDRHDLTRDDLIAIGRAQPLPAPAPLSPAPLAKPITKPDA